MLPDVGKPIYDAQKWSVLAASLYKAGSMGETITVPGLDSGLSILSPVLRQSCVRRLPARHTLASDFRTFQTLLSENVV